MYSFWIVGDNFTVRTFRNHFKKDADYYMKKNYHVFPFCNSRFASSNQNMLAQLQNSMAMGFNQTKENVHALPKYVVIVLDDDLITFLDFKEDGVATLLGTWVEWLVDSFNKLLEEKLKH